MGRGIRTLPRRQRNQQLGYMCRGDCTRHFATVACASPVRLCIRAVPECSARRCILRVMATLHELA